ncbi:hypothetical protein FKP32DRAFT_893624 [Trametes sanguinea]|nr:hypothetical protein FKP32DRAFT_893624 [Trametes sanguinea]
MRKCRVGKQRITLNPNIVALYIISRLTFSVIYGARLSLAFLLTVLKLTPDRRNVLRTTQWSSLPKAVDHIPMIMGRTGSSLNLDVLIQIMHIVFSESRPRLGDTIAIMQTCGALYLEGVKIILNDEIGLYDESKLVSFCRYMLADPINRFPLLKVRLVIGTRWLSCEAIDLLVDVFRRITALKSLSLMGADNLLASDARLLPTIAAIACLKELDVSFDEDTSHCGQLFKTIRSPLTIVRLFFPLKPISRRTHYWRERDPVRLLLPLKQSLKHIEVDSHHSIQGCLDALPHVQYLACAPGFGPYIRPLVACFPKLNSLVLNNDPRSYSRFEGCELSTVLELDAATSRIWPTRYDYQERREINRRDQMVYGTWSHLDKVRTSTLDLYVLALTHPVREIELRQIPGDRAVEMELLSRGLSDVRPSSLQIALMSDVVVDYCEVLGRTRAALVDLRSVRLDIDASNLDSSLDNFFPELSHALSLVGLASLELSFYCDRCRYWPGDRDHIEQDCRMEGALLTRDLHEDMRRVMLAIPSLRKVDMEVAHRGFLRPHFAEVRQSLQRESMLNMDHPNPVAAPAALQGGPTSTLSAHELDPVLLESL